MGLLARHLVGPRKRQRRRQWLRREPFYCRVAAAPDPAYMRMPGSRARRSATGEGGGFNGGSFLGQIEGEIAEDQVGACAFDSAEAFRTTFSSHR